MDESGGISQALAAKALVQYEKMFAEQAIHEEAEQARRSRRKRRPNGATRPELLFTGTRSGTFGLEFVPKPGSGAGDSQVHALALKKLAAGIVRDAEAAAAGGEDFLADIPPRVVVAMKQFFRELADHGAALRVAFSDAPAATIATAAVAGLAAKLDHDVQFDEVDLEGTFRGVRLESGDFDFAVANSTEVVSGRVDDEFADEDLARLLELTDQPAKARFQKTIETRIGKAPKATHVLTAFRAESDPDWTPNATAPEP